MLDPNTTYPIANQTKAVVFLKNVIHNPNIVVGDYTYYDGRGNPENFERDNVIFGRTSKLIIGKFCQIAYGTKFLLSDANHQLDGISTYPFFIFGQFAQGCPEWEVPPSLTDKGDTHVGHDVWFGHESMVMPGVKIGNGAIIGARSVVTKDVPSYSIVGGNPAKVLRYRFPQEAIATLNKVQWWNWGYEKITQNLSTILSGDVKKLEAIQ